MLLADISDVNRSFTPNKTMFTEYCLTQWISKLPGSFEIHWVNFTGVVGLVNAIIYKTELIFSGIGHGKFSIFLTLLIT